MSTAVRMPVVSMNAYSVTVRTLDGRVTFSAIGPDSGAVHMAALERFGACGVTVKPA